MNILFLTLLDFSSIQERGIYTDLIREFVRENHNVYVISPVEKRKKEVTHMIKKDDCYILKLQIGNMQKTNMIEKGISTLTIESKFRNAINKYFNDVKFDLVMYSTPPITLQKAVEYVKKRDKSKTYLLLKDIFPQNAIDIGLLKDRGLKKYIYRYFKNKERKLYEISDFIGCMSQANVDFILKNNEEISADKVEICPNSIEPINIKRNEEKFEEIKNKYDIPLDKTIFIYGGNLGKPQGIDFLIECLRANKSNDKAYFIIVGSGTESNKLKSYFDSQMPINAKIFGQLPKDEYEILANTCDVGLIFLDHRFTIPNFPSRLLSYMQASMPVIAATDTSTDMGEILENGEFGFWCESNDINAFNKNIEKLYDEKLRNDMGANARKYLEENYTARRSYEIIIKHFNR